MRVALIVNPGSGEEPEASELAEALRGDDTVVEVRELDQLPGLDLAEVERLVVAAGDGGVGPCAARAAAAGIPLAVIPSGTANDFAGFLGLPEDHAAAVRLAADVGARLREIDLCRSGDVAFVNAAACGISVAAAENAAPLKDALGATAYAVGAARASATEKPCAYTVVVDGDEVFSGLAWQVIVSGTGAFGAGSRVESAAPDDGALDVTVLEEGSRLALPLRAWGLKRGAIGEQAGVSSFRGRRVEVRGAETWNVDGERHTGGEFGHFRLDGRIEVVVP